MADPLVFSPDEDFTAERLNAAFKVLDIRLRGTEAARAEFADAVATLVGIGLERVNEVLLPAYQAVAGLAQLGVIFTAASVTPVVLGVGARTFVLSPADRDRFAAAAYIGAQKADDPTVALYGQIQSYDRETGALVVLVDNVRGTPGGTVASWRISAAATPDYATSAHQVGAYTQAEVDAAVAAVLAGVATPGNTLAKLYALTQANASALGSLTAGADASVDTFAEVFARFVANETTIGAHTTALASRLRTDAAQSLGLASQLLGRQNLGVRGAGVATKSAAYTVVATDAGKLLACTGTWTLGLTAAATLGNGYAIEIANTGTGAITIDPNASETINGSSTLVVNRGESGVLICDGTNFIAIGFSPVIVAQSLGNNGYTVWSAGLCEQWGTLTPTGGDQLVIFPRAFGSGWTPRVIGTADSSGGNTNTGFIFERDSVSSTGFNVRARSIYAGTTAPSPIPVDWRAIGPA